MSSTTLPLPAPRLYRERRPTPRGAAAGRTGVAMSTTTLPRPAPGVYRERGPVPRGPRRRGRGRLILIAAGLGFIVVLAPVVLLAGAGNPPCASTESDSAAAPTAASNPIGAPVPAGMFAAPLKMTPGRWYRVGATEFSGSFGGSGAYLPSYPDSFAELSLLDSNPYPNFTFADANALDNLPYGTAIRVANDGRQQVIVKRDVGYGQGPGQALPYRVDVYMPAAEQLGISKNPVDIELAPSSGAAAALGQLPGTIDTPGGENCSTAGEIVGSTAGLQLTSGQVAQILPNGDATAPADAPPAVKLAIAAANRIHTTYYQAERPEYLDRTYPWYDCSASTAYVLYHGGLNGTGVTVDGSTDAGNGITLEGYGDPGPGKWISVYGNSTHAFIVIAGRVFDTADFGGPDIPAGSGPRWRYDPLGNLQDGLSYVVRHPPGL